MTGSGLGPSPEHFLLEPELRASIPGLVVGIPVGP